MPLALVVYGRFSASRPNPVNDRLRQPEGVYHQVDTRHPALSMTKYLIVLSVALATSGCGLLYKQPIYQGNLIEKTAVEQLQAGMPKQQVLTLLGSPSIADPFHHQRWDYTSTQRTNRRGQVEIKNLTLWFENDALTKWEGDYFPEQDLELSERMRKFGNLPKEKGRRR